MGGQTQATTNSVVPNQAKMNMDEGEMNFVHPFFTHMGMPDPIGHYALRLSAVSAREEGHTHGDVGFHLETGLSKKWGCTLGTTGFHTMPTPRSCSNTPPFEAGTG